MKTLFFLFTIFFFAMPLFATTIIVDLNGGGQYPTIQQGISAALTNDTVKVWPGTYFEQVNLNKNIALMGSGYENTVITGPFNPTVTITAGKMMWFMISSTSGTGVLITAGTLINCVMLGCTGRGVFNNVNGSNANVYNCVVWNCGSNGIDAENGGVLNVVNCISRNNGGTGFEGWNNYYINLSYSNGSRYITGGNQGCIDQDPSFTNPPTDFHISQSSPSWDTGNPSLLDPDGSRSDMGYFGGPDCPIYPTVFSIIITPTGNNIDLQAKGRANY